MDLGELQLSIDRRTGLAFDSAAQVDLINSALKYVSAERDWPWLDALQTITGDGTTESWTLPTTWARTRALTIDPEAEEVRPISIHDMDRWENFDQRPSNYCYAIDTLSLFIKEPVPSGSTATHRYVKSEPDLAGASDLPLLPARFHPRIVAMVAEMELERMGSKEALSKAIAMGADAERWRKVMTDEQLRNRGPKRIRVRNGFGL